VHAAQPAIDKFAATLPRGYRIALGGSVEESGKSQASVMAVVPALLLVILIFQLKSFQRVLLVLSVAPLGLIGGVAALLRLVPDPRILSPREHGRG
jgi:multidrug efflux pump